MQQACGGAAVAANASGTKVPDEREQQQKSGGQALHVGCVKQSPKVGKSIEQNPEWAQAEADGMYPDGHPTHKHRAQALPLIFAHHQRTPTKRNRQSLKNSGGLPSKAWPMNWRIHPITKSASA